MLDDQSILENETMAYDKATETPFGTLCIQSSLKTNTDIANDKFWKLRPTSSGYPIVQHYRTGLVGLALYSLFMAH